LLEEAARVPLILSLPGTIPRKKTISAPVSHLDVFSTIMDYLDARALDSSDGHSLRRHVEKQNYNKEYDDDVVIAEVEKVGKKLSGKVDYIPNFMYVYSTLCMQDPLSAHLTANVQCTYLRCCSFLVYSGSVTRTGS